jgi:hypothetical protein
MSGKSAKTFLAAFVFCLLTQVGHACAGAADAVDTLLRLCGSGLKWEEVESSASGDIKLTLEALRKGELGATILGEVKSKKGQWVGIRGSFDSAITSTDVAHADKTRECLKPYMDSIVKLIIESEK